MPVDPAGLRTPGIGRGEPLAIWVDGTEVAAFEGESVLAALWAADIHVFHRTARRRDPRGFFCGIGICFDCLVTVDGHANVRACLEPVRAGMRITLQQDAGHAAHK